MHYAHTWCLSGLFFLLPQLLLGHQGPHGSAGLRKKPHSVANRSIEEAIGWYGWQQPRCRADSKDCEAVAGFARQWHDVRVAWLRGTVMLAFLDVDLEKDCT